MLDQAIPHGPCSLNVIALTGEGASCRRSVPSRWFFGFDSLVGADHRPAAGGPRRPVRSCTESHAVALDRNELGALLVVAGLGLPPEHALISLLALNGLRVFGQATPGRAPSPRPATPARPCQRGHSRTHAEGLDGKEVIALYRHRGHDRDCDYQCA
jgi:hypothetical protein